MSTSTQALEKKSETDVDRTPAVITTPQEYAKSMARWQGQFNVLTPFTNVSGIAPSFGIIASVVKVNADKAAGEVYDGLPFLKNGELALAKIGLRKLAECGGISTTTQRTDPRTIPHYWEFKAIATYRGLDGSLTTREATFEWDLRNGSDRLKGWTANQITEGRKNGLRNCEARAINAAIRECGCGIKQKYTRAELEKPFVVVRVAFQPDMNDPAVKMAVTNRALEGTSTLYPGAHQALPAATDVIDHQVADEPRHVGQGATPGVSAASTPPEAAAVDPNQPPTPDAVRIAKVETKSGVNAKTNKAWTRFVIIDSLGVEHSTFDKDLARAAEQFAADKTWVEIDEEQDGAYKNLVEIQKAGQQPSLLPDPASL